MEEYDVVVVGAGPGGSMAAFTAAGLGLETVFLERGRKPGDKNSSGCGLGQRWWRDFPEIMGELPGLPSYRKVEMVVINLVDEDNRLRMRSGTTGSDLDATRWPHGMEGASVYRSCLDPFLAKRATDEGAELRTATLASDVIMDDGRVAGIVTDAGERIGAKVVIAADGAMSTMARASGMRNRWGAGCTLVPQLDFGCDEGKLDDVIGNAEWCWFGPFYGAYQVNFREGFHLGAGQWLRRDWDTRPVDMLKRVMAIPAFQAMTRAVDARPREYQAHLLPWMEKPAKSFSAGLMLVGDAAGFPCPLEGEGVWHACTSGRIAAETAAYAIRKGDFSERTLSEYERRWRASSLGLEHEFGREFVELWDNSAFDPEKMGRQIQLLLELSMLNPFSICFDWGDAHMECLNMHLSHFLDMLPEFGEFGGRYIKPFARGISPGNVRRMLCMMKPRLPALRRLSDERYLWLLARFSRSLRPYLEGREGE
ncbi:MAG: NAD(P)/FAD-dependent oxidoreductase [Actinobacteria bacterium]|nr:NAD(P)/FAD-dependent oxidoreductase [Actinomycetota bacterium]MBU1944214.1 NAD(P)/FAD-dependent oxidoreductase [Actinomycetota bacterium]MBU2688393.1 NAD(P)/FAD-dependent oxidoreductase [Actinomycetota bacterium]